MCEEACARKILAQLYSFADQSRLPNKTDRHLFLSDAFKKIAQARWVEICSFPAIKQHSKIKVLLHNRPLQGIRPLYPLHNVCNGLYRLQEQSDLNAFKDLLGNDDVDLDTFEPKTQKDFDNLARTVANKYLLPYDKDAKFKGLLKALIKSALASSDVQQVKDLESCLAGIRADKLKEEKAASAAKKGKEAA